MANTTIPSELIADGAITSAKLDTNIAVGGTLNVSGAFTSLGIDDNATSTAITIDSSENVGIGVTPSAWGANYAALQSVLGLGLWSTRNTSATILGSNAYNANEADDRYVVSYWASKYTQVAGEHNWYTAPSGTAGDAITYTNSMTIDASGNLLVGKSATGLANAGIELTASNILRTTKASSASAEFNRTGTDGDIAIFWKDTSPVGSIGTSGGAVTIGKGITTLKYLDSLNTIHPNGTGGGSDGLTTLGWSNNRFKDLYLSGGVYLGGTGAANHLDDYEEGTWTPDVSGGGVTWLYNAGIYTKVGRLVTVTFWLQAGSTDSNTGTVNIVGLPFNTNGVGRSTACVRAYSLANFSGKDGVMAWVAGGTSTVTINAITGGLVDAVELNTNVWQSGAEIHFSLTYQTA